MGSEVITMNRRTAFFLAVFTIGIFLFSIQPGSALVGGGPLQVGKVYEVHVQGYYKDWDVSILEVSSGWMRVKEVTSGEVYWLNSNQVCKLTEK